jgi:hypothetical protein
LEELRSSGRLRNKLFVTGFAVNVRLPIMAGLDVKASEPAAAADIRIDVDSVAEIKWKVRILLGGVTADHNLAGLMRERVAEFFMNEGEGMLL